MPEKNSEIPNSGNYEDSIRDLIEETKLKTLAELEHARQLSKLDKLDVIEKVVDAIYRCVYEILQLLYAQSGMDKARLQLLIDELATRGLDGDRSGISVRGRSVDLKVRGDMIGGDSEND